MSRSNILRKTVCVNHSLAASGNFTYNLTTPFSFTPRKLIIRQLLYCNIGAGVDNGIYLVSSSLINDVIGAVYVGIQSVGLMPDTEITLFSGIPNSFTFNVTPANPNFADPTGHLTMILEFVSE